MTLLVAAAFLLRLWRLSKVHYWDEAVYLQNALVVCCSKTNYSELGSRPPLLSWIFAGVFLLWRHVYAACVVTAFINALGPAIMYFVGRMISGRLPGAIAALLLAFSPFFLSVFPAGYVSDDIGNSLLSDCPALTLILLALWLLLLALRKQSGAWFALAGFVLAMTVLMRFGSLSSVGVLSLLVLADDRRWKASVAAGAGFLAGIGPYLCWSRLRYGGFLTTFRHGWENLDGPWESPLFYVRNLPVIFCWITLAGLALWILGWAARLAKRGAEPSGHSPDEAQNAGSLWLEAFLAMWAVVVLVFFSALHHKEPRYVIPLAPSFFLLAGIGLGSLLRGRQKWSRVGGGVLLTAALAYSFAPSWQRFEAPFIDDDVSEEMRVSDFLNSNVPPGTVLYSNFNYPLFGYYTNLPVRPLLETGPELYDLLNRLPADGVLIAYRENDVGGDPRLDWLDANPHFRRLRDFPALVLYRYQATPGGGR